MAHAIKIDTLAFSKKLRAAGADERLADAIVEGFTTADTSELATKADLKEVETALRHEIGEVRHDLKWIKGIGGIIVAIMVLPLLRDMVVPIIEAITK